MSIGKTRGFLYTLARLMGDVNAVKKVSRQEGSQAGILNQPMFKRLRPALTTEDARVG
jgi:hypothetical protein